MAIGDIIRKIASLEFDTSQAFYANLIHIAGDIYAIAYTGHNFDGWLKTVSISDDGMTLSNKASLEFNTSQGYTPDTIHIAGIIYAIAYMGPGNDGWIRTVSISDDGMTLINKASLEFDNVWGVEQSIIHIAGSIYAISYRGPNDDGWLKTVSISDDGMTLSNKASLEFDPSSGYETKIIHIAGSIYAIAYRGPGFDGWLKTVSISDDGMTLSNKASLEFDTVEGRTPDIIHIAGNIYAIAYTGPGNDGWLKTVSISDDGMTLSNKVSLEFDTVEGRTPSIVHMAGNIYAIAYEGPDVDGWVKTVSISDDGMTLSIVASLEFDTTTTGGPDSMKADIIHIAGNTCAIAYQGANYDGWIKTVGDPPSAARHRFTGGMVHRALH